MEYRQPYFIPSLYLPSTCEVYTLQSGPLVEFFGVRGSYPAVGPQFARYGGHTSCLCITVAGRRLVFDGGLGMIPLGPQAFAEPEHVIFVSHLHYDHLTGLPFYAPLFGKSNRIRVFAPASMTKALATYWSPPYFPLDLEDYPASIEILATPEGEVDLVNLLELPSREGDPVLETLFLDGTVHPKNGVMVHRVSYRNRAVVYATDVELHAPGAMDAVTAFARGADLLICDTQYADKEYEGSHQGWGHNSIDLTVRLAELAGVKQLVLFHHDPKRDDDALDALQEQAQKRFPVTIAAYQGLTIQL